MSHNNKEYRILCAPTSSLLDTIDDGQASMILTDPPYNIGTFMRGRHNPPNMRGMRNNSIQNQSWDTMTPGEWERLIDHTLRDCSRILRDGGTLIMFTTIRNAPTIIRLGQEHDLYYKTVGTWHKTRPMPVNMRIQLIPSCEQWVVMTRLPSRRHHTFHPNGPEHDFIQSDGPTPTETRYGRHPTQKPVSILQHMIRLFTDPDDLVVDPFQGSGSTGVASLLEHRRYAGCDTSAHWTRIARRRCADALTQQPLL